MSNYKHDISDINNISKDIKICFIVSTFNEQFTIKLKDKNKEFLNKQGFQNITEYFVPGAFEIPGMLSRILKLNKYDLIYCFGVVIRGATTHYDYVCSESARGIMNLTIQFDNPIIYGILTCENEQQVKERITDNFAIAGLKLYQQCQKIR